MLFLYIVLLVSSLIMLVAGIVEQRRHFANLNEIPTRVLVNGIRGKSSITRLCAGALRGGGLVTVAKTTGTAARFIHPDATEEPVYRKFGIANVVEQIGIVRRAAAYRPDALVMECMAVMPPLQELNQEKLIQSTIGVLCNVREDHVAEMGPTLDDIGRSLSRSMPHGGICVTAEKDRFHILREEADARDCRLIYADPETVSDEELRGFSWFTFKENVAIALTVAELLGIDRDTALQGMYDAPPDPGVLSVERYVAPGGKRVRFANVFAANDPESTLMNINQLLDLGAISRPLNVVINCRPDRVERNGQMGQIVPDLEPDRVFVIGHPAKSAIDAIPAQWRDRAVDLGGDGRDGEEFMHELLGHLGPESSLVAIGNIHGQGEILLEHLAELPSFEEEDDQAHPPAASSAAAPAAAPPVGSPVHGVPAPRHDQTVPLYTRPLDPYADLSAAEEARRREHAAPRMQPQRPGFPQDYLDRNTFRPAHHPDQQGYQGQQGQQARPNQQGHQAQQGQQALQGRPGYPERPEHPGHPGHPAYSGHPGHPAHPGYSGYPPAPEHPVRPEPPVRPEHAELQPWPVRPPQQPQELQPPRLPQQPRPPQYPRPPQQYVQNHDNPQAPQWPSSGEPR
ncbi:poly-gamma-glutamate synthase PgsB [Streptomyces sp. NPDC089799]|uniref:poly-gamma-glutamate synthase PgsB n=1 Tax=Streptomyces sp. NPDC089799 TaxID=3155066 RepID=UPI0034150A34